MQSHCKFQRPVLLGFVWIQLAFIISIFTPPLWAMTLEEVLVLARENQPGLKSIALQLSALGYKQGQDKSRFAPALSLEVSSHYDDLERVTSYSKTISHEALLGLQKTFSLGTEISLDGMLSAKDQQTGSSYHLNEKRWQFGIKQPLLKNFAGKSFTLESSEFEQQRLFERLSLQAQAQAILVQIETKYWDLVLAVQEMKIRLESLDKGRDFWRWIRDRQKRGAAEKVDVLSAETALKSRLLSSQLAEDNISVAYQALRSLVSPLPDLKNWQVQTDEFLAQRSIETLLLRVEGNMKEYAPINTEALLAQTRVEQAIIKLEKLKEENRTDFAFIAEYAQNAVDREVLTVFRDDLSFQHQGWILGLSLNHILDANLKAQAEQAANLEAKAQKINAQFAVESSNSDWALLQDKLQRLGANLKLAGELQTLQDKKAVAERERLRIGQSTTAQLISFEQEALDAHLQVLRIAANMRKLEAQARLFTRGGI